MPYIEGSAELRPALLESTIENAGDWPLLTAHRNIATVTPVPMITGNFGRLKRGETLREGRSDVSQASGYQRGTLAWSELSFLCDKFGHEMPIDDVTLHRIGPFGDLEAIMADVALRRMLVAEARRMIALFWTNETGIPTDDVTGRTIGDEWDDYDAADPVVDVLAGVNSINSRSGHIGSQMTLHLHWRSLLDIAHCDAIRVKYGFQYTGDLRTNVDYAQIAAALTPILGVGAINILGAPTNAQPQGATPVISDLWDREYALLTVTAADSSVQNPTCGRIFVYEPLGGLEQMETYEEKARDIISIPRARQCVQEQLIDTDLVFRFDNCYTAA